MKKVSFLFFSLLFIFGILGGISTIAFAAEDSIDDQASLFTDDQISELKKQITPIEEKTKARIFIVTNADNNTDSTTYADNFMSNQIGNDQNGVTFYIDMNQSNFIVSTSGNMIDYLSDSRLNSMLNTIKTSMINRNFYAAAETFLNKTSYYFDQGIPDRQYRIDTETGKITYIRTLTPGEIAIAFIGSIALALFFFIITISRYKLRFSKYKYPFKDKSSLQLFVQKDTLINSFTTTRRIPKNKSNGGGRSGGGGSSTHTSGGGTFGGGGRSF